MVSKHINHNPRCLAVERLIQLFHQSRPGLFVFWRTSIAALMSIVINLSLRVWIHHDLSLFFEASISQELTLQMSYPSLCRKAPTFLQTVLRPPSFPGEMKAGKPFYQSQIMQCLFYISDFHTASGIDWQVKKVAIRSVHRREDQIKRAGRVH